jgi:hypothetical protein
MRPLPLDSATEIEITARFLLKESKAFGVFPTPVDLIVHTAELKVAEGVDLSRAKQNYFSKAFEGIGRISRKVLGLLDFRNKTIYLDLEQSDSRQRFVKLHEVGHDVLTWQGEAYRWDDEKTLDPFVKQVFEREASYFASAALLQLDRFDEEAEKLPLCVGSPIALSRKFGSSCQATIRRYVECSRKRCAVLVLELPDVHMNAKIRNCFESSEFAKEFGILPWPDACDPSFPFVRDMLRYRKFHQDGKLLLKTDIHGQIPLRYHYFNNGFNGFIFLFPPGEHIRSKTRIIPAGQ